MRSNDDSSTSEDRVQRGVVRADRKARLTRECFLVFPQWLEIQLVKRLLMELGLSNNSNKQY